MKRHPCQSILALAATAFSILGFTATSASAQIIIDDILPVVIGGGNQGTTGLQIVASYDASSSSKLVVVVSTEHGFGTGFGMVINSVEYNGQAMIQAVQENTLPGAAAIFYLDTPGPAGEIRIIQGNQNGGLATVYALSNTATGVGGIGQSLTNTVDVTTTSPSQLLIACILDGGQAANGNAAGAPTAVLPLIQDHRGIWGGNLWGGHGAGHQFVAPGITTSTFNTAGPNLLRTVAVAFHECVGVCTPGATREQYGDGCTSSFASLYELSDTASFDLTDTDIMGTYIGAGYLVLTNAGTGPLPVGGVDPLGGTVLVLPDDGQVVAGTLGMSVGSNGWMALGAGNSNAWSPTAALMLSNPSEGVYTWTDLQPNMSGVTTYEEDVATGQCRVTFDGVVGWGTPDPCYIQLDYNVNSGDWAIRFGTVGFANPEDWIVGYSPAGLNADPGSTDISAAGPILTGALDIFPLTVDSNNPSLGSNWDVTTSNIDPLSPIAITFFGARGPAIPATLVGFAAPGCDIHLATTLTSAAAPNVGGSAVTTIPIPNNIALAGFQLSAQSICLTASNVANLLFSNGVQGTLGL
jgi:hypothetical protein